MQLRMHFYATLSLIMSKPFAACIAECTMLEHTNAVLNKAHFTLACRKFTSLLHAAQPDSQLSHKRFGGEGYA